MNKTINRIYRTGCVDPFRNLAAEELLFSAPENATATVLFLWQNQNAVVIGRNQNAFRECRLPLLEQEGGRLARRSTGGGAVFHDLGNLNFSFVLPRDRYDVSRQLFVIVRALAAFGVSAEASGRNDLTLAGSQSKFSGNAFRFSKTMALHHGTLLVDTDLDRLSRYLAPPEQKYLGKGIPSVRSRVVNLSGAAPDLTVPALGNALIDAFRAKYGPAEERDLSADLPAAAWAAETERYASDAWRLGRSPSFDATFSTRLPLGQIELHLSMTGGLVSDCAVYSDAMDASLPPRLESALIGCPFRARALAERALAATEDAALSAWLSDLAL